MCAGGTRHSADTVGRVWDDVASGRVVIMARLMVVVVRLAVRLARTEDSSEEEEEEEEEEEADWVMAEHGYCY